MNEKSYNQSIRLQKEYETLRQQFLKLGGILTPIIAVEVKTPVDSTSQHIRTIVNVLTDKSRMVGRRRPIGYMAALKADDGTIRTGYSLLSIRDYQKWNPVYGKIQAMTRALAPIFKEPWSGTLRDGVLDRRTDRSIDHPYDMVTWLFPDRTIAVQRKLFVVRTNQQFAKETDN